MPEPIVNRTIRVGFYGTGRFANSRHIPILQKLDGLEIVALCDIDEDARMSTAEKLGIDKGHVYADGLEMLASEELDVLFSCVRAHNRIDVEATAARKGVHLFSEKPQATDFATARKISEAVQEGGAFSTVGFRERYRPMFHQLRAFLADKQVTHTRFTFLRPALESGLYEEEVGGGYILDWGVHAVDYTRYMTGLEFVQAQAYYNRPPEYDESLSASFNFQLSGGATTSLHFVTVLTSDGGMTDRRSGPLFTLYYLGGWVDIYRDSGETWSYDVNGEPVVVGETFDPWAAHDEMFIEAVRSGDDSAMRNDYADGLLTLGPMLAGWESSRQGGGCVDVKAFTA